MTEILDEAIADEDILTFNEKESMVACFCPTFFDYINEGIITVVNRVDVTQRVPPRNIKEMKSHPESSAYFAALIKELNTFKRTGNLMVPDDLDIHNIPPAMILQLMPLFSKKYEGLNFSKFKYRIVVLGNHWKNVHGVSTFSDMVDMNTLKVLVAIAAVE